MKNLTIIVYFLLLSIVVSSCKFNRSVTSNKRKYRKGYYLAKRPKGNIQNRSDKNEKYEVGKGIHREEIAVNQNHQKKREVRKDISVIVEEQKIEDKQGAGSERDVEIEGLVEKDFIVEAAVEEDQRSRQVTEHVFEEEQEESGKKKFYWTNFVGLATFLISAVLTIIGLATIATANPLTLILMAVIALLVGLTGVVLNANGLKNRRKTTGPTNFIMSLVGLIFNAIITSLAFLLLLLGLIAVLFT